MRHYLFVGDGDAGEVLGVWEVHDDLSATKLSIQLSLTYPGFETVGGRAPDFESFKARHQRFNFGAMLPEGKPVAR